MDKEFSFALLSVLVQINSNSLTTMKDVYIPKGCARYMHQNLYSPISISFTVFTDIGYISESLLYPSLTSPINSFNIHLLNLLYARVLLRYSGLKK